MIHKDNYPLNNDAIFGTPLGRHRHEWMNYFKQSSRSIWGSFSRETYSQESCSIVITTPVIITNVYMISNLFHLVQDILLPLYVSSKRHASSRESEHAELPLVFLSVEFTKDFDLFQPPYKAVSNTP